MSKTEHITQIGPVSSPSARYSQHGMMLVSALFALGTGLVASLLAVVLMLLLRLLAGIPTPVELFGDFLLKHINVSTFIQLLSTFAPNSKTAPLGLALLGMVALGMILGVLYAAIVRLPLPLTRYRPGRSEWFTALGFAFAMTLLGTVLFWDELRQNLFGWPIGTATFLSSLALLADFGLYSFTLCLGYRALLPRYSPPDAAIRGGRRQLLSRAGIATLGIGASAGTLGLIRQYLDEYTSYDGAKTPLRDNRTVPITPNDEHYIVTQNAIDPSPDVALWRLEVTGLVKQSGSYTYEEVKQLPSISRAITLECIANGPDIHLMSTAIWQGVSLRTLLDRHGGALPEGKYIAFHSVDGYTISLPLDEVLASDPILAWSMNGQAVPVRHGFPMRVLIPGRYGEENPKWLTRVEVADRFIGGLYANQGWYHGLLHTTSRIDFPRPNDHLALGHQIELSGLAFAGNRGIRQVEVSVDGGVIWQPAVLQPALSQDSWVLWSLPWTPTAAGLAKIIVRATDGTGTLQTDHKQGTVPDGATGLYEIKVQIG